MAQYYDAEKVKAKYPPIMGGGQPRELRYNHYRALSSGKRLIGVFDKSIWKVCVDVSDKSEFDEFELQYSQGLYVRRDYYAVPEKDLESLK